MRVEVWFDFFAHPKRGSDDRGLASVSFCAPSRLDLLPVVIFQSDAFEPQPPGGAEPTRDGRVAKLANTSWLLRRMALR